MSNNEDIKNGNGLKPIETNPSSNKPSGITTEQRGFDTGIRHDKFTKQDQKGNNNVGTNHNNNI